MTVLTGLLDVEHLTYSWGKSSDVGRESTLRKVSFGLLAGEIKAILGPNGSGKSTLLRLMSGLIPLSPTRCKGRVRSRGRDLLTLPSQSRASVISYLGSDFNSEFPLTVETAVALGGLFTSQSPSGRLETVQAALERCLCQDLRHQDLRSLSGGQRQLAGLARAMVQSPEILLLDESLSKMDLDHQHRISQVLREWVRDKNSAVLWVSHDLHLAAQVADSALWLRAGEKIGDGRIFEMLAPAMLKQVYPHAGGLN